MRLLQDQCFIEYLSIFNKLGIDSKDSVIGVRQTNRFFNALILFILIHTHFLPTSPIIVREETAGMFNPRNIWHVNFKTQRNQK